jgi:hypothetical protein
MINKTVLLSPENYSFDKATKQVTLIDIATVSLIQFRAIFNVTREEIIFSPIVKGKGGSVTGSVLTLNFDTTGAGFANTDELQIHYSPDSLTDPTLVADSGLTNEEIRLNPLSVTLDGGSITVDNLTATFDSTVSTVNSTDVLLAANEEFIGEWELVKNYAGVTVSISTDQSSAIGGGRAQWSTDGTDLGIFDDGTLNAVTIPAGLPASFEFAKKAAYFRIKYKNGATAQTALSAQVIYNLTAATPNKRILGSPLTDYDSAIAVASHMSGRQATGQWKALAVDALGNLSVSIQRGTVLTFNNYGANSTLNVKASLGTVKSLTCFNKSVTNRYIQLHDTATVPSSVAVPKFSILVPSNSQQIIGTDFFTDNGIEFSSGIAFAFSATPDVYTGVLASDQSTTINYI